MKNYEELRNLECDVKEISEKLNDTHITYKLSNNNLVRNTIMNVFGKIVTDFEMYYNYISLKEDDIIYVLYNDKNNFPKLNKRINTIIKFKSNIGDVKVSLYAFKVKSYKYNIIKKKFYNNIKSFYEFTNNYKSDIKRLKDKINELEKEYNDILKNEQLNNLFSKLKENKEIKKINDNENNIYKLINMLEKQKVDKLYILADIGKELKEQNINDENKFMNEIKNKDLYYIYDLKNKNKISRFINMCNKLYLLKDKVELKNIISKKFINFN